MVNKQLTIINCNNISKFNCFYSIFDQIIVALVNIRDFVFEYQKQNQKISDPKLV